MTHLHFCHYPFAQTKCSLVSPEFRPFRLASCPQDTTGAPSPPPLCSGYHFLETVKAIEFIYIKNIPNMVMKTKLTESILQNQYDSRQNINFENTGITPYFYFNQITQPVQVFSVKVWHKWILFVFNKLFSYCI